MDTREIVEQESNHRLGVRRMTDLRRNDESQPSAGSEQRGGNNNKRCPRGSQTREFCPESLAEVQSCLTHLALELLIANERRIPSNAIKTFTCSVCPIEKIRSVDSGMGDIFDHCRNRRGIPVHSDRVGMGCQKPAVTAGRVQQTVGRRPDNPPHEHVCDLWWRIE